MKLNIPTIFKGIDTRKAYEKALKEKEPAPSTLEKKAKTASPIIPLSDDLSFVTDINLYKEFVEYVDSAFSSHKNVLSDKLKFENGVMKGSNTYIATAFDEFLRISDSKYRLATPLDLESDLNFTKDTYNDSGLALRSLIGDNKEQAQYIFNQLKQRGIKESAFPIWLNLRGLRLDKNLNFNLTDESFFEKAECLNWASGTKFSKINDFGLPKEKDENSSRQIWTSNDALSRAYLSGGSVLSSDDSVLALSDDFGRVVFAKLRSS